MSRIIKSAKRPPYSATFLEPTYARHMFPCWDEPALKATFAVSLISHAGMVNLSNMPSFFEGPYDPVQDPLEPSFAVDNDATDWIITRFETMPKMSTYILAFANGPFAHLESSYTTLSGRICPVRTYATPDLIGQAQFSVDLITRVLPMLEKMFDLEYPLPKMDILNATGALGPQSRQYKYGLLIVLVPHYTGALENWGLIVGDPSVFLFNPDKESTATQKRVVYICFNCYSFDVLCQLTMAPDGSMKARGQFRAKDYADFFVLLDYRVRDTHLLTAFTDKLYPEWNITASVVNGTFKDALNVDARLSSHPVQVECPDANNVNEALIILRQRLGTQTEPYLVLRMLSSLLGEVVFLKGVSLYLKERQFGNSVVADLWNTLSRSSGTDVVNLMENWILKTGYPFITVTEALGEIEVRQNRFLASGIADEKDDETIWTVPLNLLTIDSEGTPNVDKFIFLSERHKFIPLDTSKPFKLNASTTGFYRVLYDSEKLNKLALDAAKRDLCDRAGLMNDTMALAKSNLAKLSSALILIDGFMGETNSKGIAQKGSVEPVADHFVFAIFWPILLDIIRRRHGISGAQFLLHTRELRVFKVVEHEYKHSWGWIATIGGPQVALTHLYRSVKRSQQLYPISARELRVRLSVSLPGELLYPAGESTDTSAVRTLAIKRGVMRGILDVYPNTPMYSIVAELKRLFATFMKTGDASWIPPELASTIYTIVSKLIFSEFGGNIGSYTANRDLCFSNIQVQ
ncbi:peptidase family M1-domain-containing protein [Mycena vulgaris]|nr:peptidase family M1-domain-containing protein [Mycena vulgaris]